MKTVMIIEVPESLQKYNHLLKGFFDGMIMKLDKNSHKETPTKETVANIINLLMDEIQEFENQLEEDRFNENSLIELMDAANFAFLAYVALRLEGVPRGK